MAFLVQLTDDAMHDLEEICDYIDQHGEPGRSDYVLEQIEKAFSSLSEYPERGNYPAELLDIGIREYREIFSRPYRIIYRVMENNVYVLLIADGRRGHADVATATLVVGIRLILSSNGLRLVVLDRTRTYNQKPHLARMIRLGIALVMQQLGECLRVLQVVEDFGFAADYGEITGGQGGQVSDFGWSFEGEIGVERRLRLGGGEIVEGNFEGEAAQGGRVEVFAEVGRAGRTAGGGFPSTSAFR